MTLAEGFVTTFFFFFYLILYLVDVWALICKYVPVLRWGALLHQGGREALGRYTCW